MKDYPRAPRLLCRSSTVLSSSALPKRVDVPCEHVGACIVVHGVNDVGTGYQAVEEGLLDGLARRLGWTTRDGTGCPPYTPAHYRMPTDDDARNECSSADAQPRWCPSRADDQDPQDDCGEHGAQRGHDSARHEF